MQPDPVAVAADSVELELLRNELLSAAEEMAIAMIRTARSLSVREGGDVSTAITDANGHLVAQGLAMGIHLGYIESVMPYVLAKFGGDIGPDDVVISNDPYAGMSHLPDVVAIMPVFHEGEIVAFVAAMEHHTDMGGAYPGSMSSRPTEIIQEGVRIPGVKLVDGGVVNRAVVEIIGASVRAPDDVVGDLMAQIAACRKGAAAIGALAKRYGTARFSEHLGRLIAIGAQRMRRGIAELPDGVYRHEEFFEDDGHGLLEPGLPLVMTLTVSSDEVTIDFEGTAPQAASAINVPLGMTKSAVYVAFRSFTGENDFANAGMLEPIAVVAPQGSLVNPTFPAAVGARGMLLWRVIDMTYQVLAQAAPGRIFAGSEGGANAMVFMPDGDTARPLLEFYTSGWGARPDSDGIDGVANIAVGGSLRSVPAEIVEREHPVVVDAFGLLPDSGGPGRYRGALALYRRWRFLRPGRVQVRTCRVNSPPYGLAGGHPGRLPEVRLERDGRMVEVPRGVSVEFTVEQGDLLTHVQPGSGGYGPPKERDGELVRSDVREGKVSVQQARDVYGVDPLA